MSFKFLNEGRGGNATEVTPIDTFIDPVSKIRVSNPSNLIDTDFEYGLQPTKWETVEIINNTPAFFSRSGDTTIPDITGIITNAGTREITVTTAFPHNLAVGIPIRVSGTKSLTADGSYIINATPSLTTFTYLALAPQPDTVSIFDLYSSIITGEFFQGSQITVDDAEGITTQTDQGNPNSVLSVKTPTKHGFGVNTPFYFLNLNSTISQEFESQNSSALSFDPTNSATAQTFDGSNTSLQTPIDLSNSATTATVNNIISGTNSTASTFSVTINVANRDKWAGLRAGDPLYYNVNAGSGYFQSNPRGVVFIKSVSQINAPNGTATFQVSELPDGEALPVIGGITGTFVIADRAKTFAGNNVDPSTQIDLTVEVGQTFNFDGGNQGYAGGPGGIDTNIGKVFGYSGSTVALIVDEGTLDYYPGAMLKYSVEDSEPGANDAQPAAGLVNQGTYFVRSFQIVGPGLFEMTIAELPGESSISFSGGTGTGIQKFQKIGVSIDKNIVHIKNSNFAEEDMLEYVSPANGAFEYETREAAPQKRFFFVLNAYDSHNYELREREDAFQPIVATGGDRVFEVWDNGRLYKVHEYTTVGQSTFEVQTAYNNSEVECLVIAGGGGGGRSFSAGAAGGGGAGGLILSSKPVQADVFPVIVGQGGSGATASNTSGNNGATSSVFGLSAVGGGGGSRAVLVGLNGGSGGGAGTNSAGADTSGGLGTPGQGNNGGSVTSATTNASAAGGGGAGQVGENANANVGGGKGGDGLSLTITGTAVTYAGGGGGAGQATNVPGEGGTGGGGAGGGTGLAGSPGTNGLGAGGGGGGGEGNGGNGGSGVVIIRYPLSPINKNIISATGGETSTVVQGNTLYAVHEFKKVGTSSFIITKAPVDAEIEYLVVAGGGSGGAGGAGAGRGGGGAGGLSSGSLSVQAGSISVTVGAGGAAVSTFTAGVNGNPGSASIFGTVSTVGGGGGAGSSAGGNGGSGGGGSSLSPFTAGTGTVGQGNSGGVGSLNSAAGIAAGGGGGGAGAVGQAGSDSGGGNGGTGIASSITGTSVLYAGGGGGSANETTPSGSGGAGGGGAAGKIDATPGTDGLGGGGGAVSGGSGTVSKTSGAGGSGIVIVRYPVGSVD